MENFAIIVIGYNRVHSLERLLNALESAEYDNDNITLIISLDFYPETMIRDYAKEFNWSHGNKILRFSDSKLGLRNHVLQCGNYLYEYQFDAIAVFEDDIFPSKFFYQYMKEAVRFYKNKKAIAGIAFYSFLLNPFVFRAFSPALNGFDTYLMQFPCSWGQIWTYEQWDGFYNWYYLNKNISIEADNVPKAVSDWPETSWLKYYTKYCIDEKKFFVYPYHALSTNFNEAGTHVKKENSLFQVPIQNEVKKYRFCDLDSKVIYDAFFERLGVGESLKISDDDLCVDLYNTKKQNSGRRYWLSTTVTDYKCIASYSLSMKPHEENVINKIKGDDIFLYDTMIENPIHVENSEKLVLYGCGNIGKKWLKHLGKSKVYCFADSYKHDKSVDGKKVIGLDELVSIKDKVKIYITVLSDNVKMEIYETLKRVGLEENIIGAPYLDKMVYADYNTKIDMETKFEGRNAVLPGVCLDHCHIGYASYISANTVLSGVKIGRYSCIGPNIRIVRGQHPTKTFVSIHPIFYSTQQTIRKTYVIDDLFDEFRYTKGGYVVEIGNDVWIGDGAMIMEGVCIADGTIIAAGANVVKDTEPYSIVGGNPAKVIRYRFNESQIAFLQDLQWWNKAEKWIDHYAEYFVNILRLQEKVYGEKIKNEMIE